MKTFVITKTYKIKARTIREAEQLFAELTEYSHEQAYLENAEIREEVNYDTTIINADY